MQKYTITVSGQDTIENIRDFFINCATWNKIDHVSMATTITSPDNTISCTIAPAYEGQIKFRQENNAPGAIDLRKESWDIAQVKKLATAIKEDSNLHPVFDNLLNHLRPGAVSPTFPIMPELKEELDRRFPSNDTGTAVFAPGAEHSEKTNVLAVIYANESNVWDNDKHAFHYGKNFDEMSYAMPLAKAEEILAHLQKDGEYPDAYIREMPEEEAPGEKIPVTIGAIDDGNGWWAYLHLLDTQEIVKTPAGLYGDTKEEALQVAERYCKQSGYIVQDAPSSAPGENSGHPMRDAILPTDQSQVIINVYKEAVLWWADVCQYVGKDTDLGEPEAEFYADTEGEVRALAGAYCLEKGYTII